MRSTCASAPAGRMPRSRTERSRIRPEWLLAHVARGIAYRAVRNRGTVGGSLAHADPAADWLTTMAVLGATIIIQGTGGTRSCPAAAFVRGPFATALGPAELIVAIEVPRLSPAARWGYHTVCRKTGEFARAIGAAVLDERHGLARVVTGATGGAPIDLPRTAARLAEAGATAASAMVADELAAASAAPRHGRCTPSPCAGHWRSWQTRHRPQRGQARGSQNPLRTRVANQLRAQHDPCLADRERPCRAGAG